MVRPTLEQDIRWGIRNGLGFTAILLAPAAAAFVLSGGRATQLTPTEVGVIFAYYVSVGAVGGVLMGAFRPALRR